jgi:hypothetical protein
MVRLPGFGGLAEAEAHVDQQADARNRRNRGLQERGAL